MSIPTKCPACDYNMASASKVRYAPTSMNTIQNFKESGIYTCEQCNFSGIVDEIKKEHLNEYYAQHYNGKAIKADSVSKTQHLIQSKTINLNPRYLAQLQLLRQYKDLSENTQILEIGCGKGDLFNILTHAKINGKFFALEPQKATFSILEQYGVEVLEADITEVCEFSTQFDIIIMSHSLEHFNPSDLKTIVENIYNGLKVGGLFLCEVPNADLSKFPNAAENIVPHLSFFTTAALSALISRHRMKELYLQCVGKSQSTKTNSVIIDNLAKKGHYADKRIGDTVFFENLHTKIVHDKIAKNALRRQRYLALLQFFLGNKLAHQMVNKLKLLKYGHPARQLTDETNVVRNDGENIRLVAQK